MNEEIIAVSRTHFKVLFPAILIQVGLMILHVLIFMFYPETLNNDFLDKWSQLILHGIILCFELWYVVFPVLRWWNESFTLTDHRVINQWGVLSKQSREIDLDRIVSISEERDIIDRLFGCGTLNFYDAAASSQPRTSGSWNRGRNRETFTGIKFNDVPNIKEFRGLVEQARRTAKTIEKF